MNDDDANLDLKILGQKKVAKSYEPGGLQGVKNILRMKIASHPKFFSLTLFTESFGVCLLHLVFVLVLDNFMAESFALSARVSHQKCTVGTLDLSRFVVRCKNHAEALYTLLQKSDMFYKLPIVKVCSKVGIEGWELLAKSFNLQKGNFVCRFSALAKVMRRTRKEDLKTIWDTVAIGPLRTGNIHISSHHSASKIEVRLKP